MFKRDIPDVERLRETRDVAGLIRALEYEDHSVHGKAALALGDFGAEPGVVPALMKVLEDREIRVRMDPKRLIGFSVSDPYIFSRENAAWALKKIGPTAKDAVPVLVRVLKNVNESETIRFACAQALGAMGGAAIESVPTLIETLHDKSRWVRDDAHKALVRITGRDSGRNRDEWSAWWREKQRNQ